ncbi:MAG: NERD domain-containing protein [Actinomycetia bacterium]|nr:NERD domain-containing protein [Actinomycetes bacterium]
MAKMIPPYVDSSNRNIGENLVFDLFKEQTPADWIVLHSLNIPESDQSFGSEIDFLVMAPGLGIFCLEVKGGSICRKDGVWIISDSQGRYYEKTISPLQQAAEGMYNLKGLIKKRLGPNSKYYKLFVSYGFIFTGNEYDIEDAETDAWRIYDRRQMDMPLKDYISLLSKRSADIYKKHKWFDPVHSFPSRKSVETLKNMLKGDFEKIKIICSRVEEIEHIIARFTDEQYRCLDGLEQGNPRCLFKGAAGTGKTMLALESAKRSAAAGNKTLITCFNKLLAGWLGTQLRLQGFDKGVKAMAFLDYSEEIARDCMPPGVKKNNEYYKKDLPLYALEALDGDKFEKFDKIIIDEGQDILSEEYLDLIDMLLKGGIEEGRWDIFCDFERQNIFNEDTDSLEIFKQLQSRCLFTPYSLTINCRNTIEIAREISRVVGFENHNILKDEASGIPVTYKFYKDRKDTLGLLLEEIHSLSLHKVRPRDITILSPHVLEKSTVKGITKKHDIINLSQDFERFFDRNTYTYSTIHKFKGMDNSYIIIVDLDDMNENRAHLDYYKSLLYIGMSRAKAGLIMLVNEEVKGLLNLD